MYGFKPTTQRGAENSGMVRGPGTGTSDSVKDAVPPGTYIMPADSTQQIGAPALAGLGFRPGMGNAAKAAAPAAGLGFKAKRKAEGEQEEAQERGPGLGFHPAGVPVNLSNGEYKLPPEQVHAVGAQVLDAMKGATHVPVEPRGFRPGGAAAPQQATDELYFADGGLVEDPTKKPRSQATSLSNTFPASQSSTVGNIYAKSNADIAQGVSDAAGFVARGFPGTTAALKGAGEAIQDAYKQGGVGAAIGQGFRGAMVPAVGLADDVMGSAAKVLDPAANALKTLVTGDATPIGQAPAQPALATPAAAQPVPAKPAASSTPAQPGTPAAMASASPAPATTAPAALAGFPGKPTGVAGVTRIDEPGKPPMFTNVGPGSPGSSAQPGAAGASPDVLGILQRESQIRAGMAPLMDQIRFNEGTRGNGNYFGFRRPSGDEGGAAALADPSVERNAERDRSAAMSAASRPMPGSPNGQLTASQRSQMVDMAGRDQTAATARYQADSSAAMQRDMTAMREAGETARSAQREAGANARAQAASQIQQDELGLKREAQGFQTREAERRESLVAKYEAAKTPEERAQIAQHIRDMSGREPAKPDNGLAVARTNLIGELGKQYAQVQPIGDDKKPVPFETWAAPMLRAAGMGATDPRQQEGVMLKGKDGKSYQVRNGVPMLVEAAARPAPAVGDVVAGHRFRGGNPNDRASWEAVR